MLDRIPDEEEMTALLGKNLYDVWSGLCALIDGKYDMDRRWGPGGNAWKYEYKYRRRGKIVWALWLFWGKRNGQNLKGTGKTTQKRWGRHMTGRKLTTTGNG